MNDRVKVGADEWLSVQAGGPDLITDGLRGCVAVGLAGGGRIALSHVYSACNDEARWQAYEKQLNAAFDASALGPPGQIKAVIVDVDDTGKFLPQRLARWLQDKGVERIDLRVDEGCRVLGSPGGSGAHYLLKDDDLAADYDRGYQTSADGRDGVNQALLSEHGGAATKIFADVALPSPSASDGPLLTQPGHPHGDLYRSILQRIGEMEDQGMLKDRRPWQEQVAAELTRGCVAAQIYDSIDAVGYGRGEREDELFVFKGPQESSYTGVGVDIFKTDAQSLANASRDTLDAPPPGLGQPAQQQKSQTQ
ncbi:XVIPCD domain-containing protein [Lysobacter antibioticus]|uniref:XVIPCD domain-containing protein n=1 Tax=Lysobacter antibioticus TaxID=84531 RepID=UPI00034D4392|nr:XVIPCD domain-containing protein [Lysobacter antibioticus]